MRSHIITGVVAATAAVAASVGIEHAVMPPPAHVVEQRVQTSGKYAWGDLSDSEQSALVAMIGNQLRGKKVEVYCGGGWCHDLAQDLDEVMDRVGAKSTTEVPFIALGAGLGVSPSTPETRALAAALDEVTSGR